VQYPESTTKANLNASATNCLSHQSDQNTTYTKCDIDKGCFVATVLIFESYSAEWKKKEQHRGCWPKLSIHNPNCSSSCSFNTRQKSIQFVSFCSCTGSLCNEMDLLYARLKNLTHCHTITATSPTFLLESNSSRSLVITIAISSATLLFIVAVLLSCLKQKDKKNTCTLELAQTLVEGDNHNGLGSENLPPNTLEDLLHGNLIHLGYHSAIRLGSFCGETVAVKVIPPKCSSQFDNEVDIFRILENHPNIAKFITCDQPLCQGRGIILLEYYQAGSLLNFLRHHTLTWTQMMRISHSIAAGIAYLHRDNVPDNTISRPGISHRDLNSRNILMKFNGTCVLADFGFALKLIGKPSSKCHVPVGSPRYMAPEILLRTPLSNDWKLSLKQVDIYAFGLVLWEVCRSCYEICSSGTKVPSYMLPYEEELSSRPSLNKVKYHVCDLTLRPNLPEQWDPDDVNLSSFKMIIQRCWQYDWMERPKAGELLIELKTLLDDSCRPCETIDKPYSRNNLYFKSREISQSLDEYMYDDRDEISQSLLSYHIEKVLTL